MNSLDINTNGSWRTVIRDLRPSIADTVKEACVDITSCAVQVGGPKAGPSWRLRDAEGYVFLHCAYDPTSEVTAWAPTAFARRLPGTAP